MRFLSTDRIARASATRPWVVVAVWAGLFIAGAIFASQIGSVLTSEFKILNNPESDRADKLLEERLRGPEVARELVIVQSPDATVDDARFESYVTSLLGDIRTLDDVASATSFYETNDPSMVSDDRHETLLPVTLKGEEKEAADHVAGLLKLVDERSGEDGFLAVSAGNGSIDREANKLSSENAERGEMIGIPIALVILLIVFGAAVAAGIPLVLAIVSIVIAVGVTTLIGQMYDLSFLVLNIITMIGLAVGIDYSLFIVQRYREERDRGLDKMAAIEMAGATSSRAVLFSGGTVIVALLGMFIVPSNIYRSLATGAIVVAIFAVLAALTLLPAILSLLGDRVNALRLPFLSRRSDDGGGFWSAIAHGVMAHPVISVVATVALLVAAAIPYFQIEPGLAGVETLPKDSESRQAFELLDREFTGGLIGPAEIVIDVPNVSDQGVQTAIGELRARIGQDPQFGETSVETNDAGDLAVVSALISGDPQSAEAHEAIRRLRNDYIPAAFDGIDANVLVTGPTAGTEDMFNTIADATPYVFAFVLGLSFVLLLVVFRSIVVPVKALVMNLLSVGATYGLLVLVFERGIGNEIFGFQQIDTIEAWLPLFLFSILFGLSMDYHVFLLSRIKERWDQTGDNKASVEYGLRSTAALITGAALIMVAVFSGFAMGDISSLQQTGFGLAVAVTLDATIIRTVLVPASMALLGDWNWYLPSWLKWLPDIGIEGPAHARAHEREMEHAYGSGGGGR
jgi:RND superfamily putative drug exporter